MMDFFPSDEDLKAQLPDFADAQLLQEARALMVGVLAHGYLNYVQSDAAHPRFMPSYSLALNHAAPNADTHYLQTQISGEGSYRLTGRRGGIKAMNAVVTEAPFHLTGALRPALGDYDFDDLAVGPGGEFEVLLSGQRPNGYQGDWWRLDPRATGLTIRQVSYDWGAEDNPLLTIDRLDSPVSGQRRSAEELEARMALLSDWVRNGSFLWFDHVRKFYERDLLNRLEIVSYAQGGGLPSQTYFEGLFEISDDEALILEVEPPECFYWSVLLATPLFSTVDWVNNQSSLNGAQAVLDADGRFRAVISARDPGVPNWLDPGGHRRGIVQGRWLRADAAPLPRLTKVSLAELRSHLPPGTRQVGEAERDTALRERRRAAQSRRLW